MVDVGETFCCISKEQVITKIEWNTPLGLCSATRSEDGKNYTFVSMQTRLDNLTLAECTLAYCMFIGMIPPHADQPFRVTH